MTEYVLVYCRHVRDDGTGKVHAYGYVVGSARQGALQPLISLFEHYAGEYSYVLFNYTLRPLRSQMKEWERMEEFVKEGRWFLDCVMALWGSEQETGPGLEKP